MINNYLSTTRRIRFLKHGPYFRFDSLPTSQVASFVFVFQSEPSHDVLFRRFVSVEVKSIENLQGFLGVPVGRVGHPTTGLHLGVKFKF